MKIEVLGGYGGQSLGCRTTCLLINDRIALDAGSLSQALSIDRQLGVHSILLTHSHMDHTSSLPFFIENVFNRAEKNVDLYTSSPTAYAIRKNLFNNATWPDFTRLPNHLLPALRFNEIRSELPFELDGVRFTPIEVDHLIPTHGFLIQQDGQAVLWSSDTGPTQRLWEVANETRNLQAVCIDVSFPSEMQQIADVSFHLTPSTLATELGKLERKVPILLHHLKPPHAEAIRAEVARMDTADLDFLEQGKVYEF